MTATSAANMASSTGGTGTARARSASGAAARAPAARPQPGPVRVLIPPRIGHPDASAAQRVITALAGTTMGTTWSLRYCAAPDASDAPRAAEIQRLLDEAEAEFSPWLPDSMSSRWRALAPGAALDLSPAAAQVLDSALHVARASAGAFDPTAAALVEAWGFGPGRRHDDPAFRPPEAAALAALVLGHDRLQLEAPRRLRQPGGMALDFCAVAKGWAVDRVSAWLSAQGLHDHLVEVGGELRGCGRKPDGQPWWVAVEPPAVDTGLRPTRVALHGLAVATSGNYRRRWHDGRRWRPHTLDPRTREPVAHALASVTVLHDSAMWADAWSTAIMVLGPREGLALAATHGLAALLQWPDEQGVWHEAASPALAAMDL